MAFAYYNNLKPYQKKVYEQSDRIASVDLPQPERFDPLIKLLGETLESGNRAQTEDLSTKLVIALARVYKIPHVKMKVLSKRPSKSWGELHGLYEQDDDESMPQITVWMRTAKRKDVVSFKTFLRTVLHEFMHHMDYTYFRLQDSFHTEGFYKRESCLLRNLLREDRQK